jgi:hypothetical protein
MTYGQGPAYLYRYLLTCNLSPISGLRRDFDRCLIDNELVFKDLTRLRLGPVLFCMVVLMSCTPHSPSSSCRIIMATESFGFRAEISQFLDFINPSYSNMEIFL